MTMADVFWPDLHLVGLQRQSKLPKSVANTMTIWWNIYHAITITCAPDIHYGPFRTKQKVGKRHNFKYPVTMFTCSCVYCVIESLPTSIYMITCEYCKVIMITSYTFVWCNNQLQVITSHIWLVYINYEREYPNIFVWKVLCPNLASACI